MTKQITKKKRGTIGGRNEERMAGIISETRKLVQVSMGEYEFTSFEEACDRIEDVMKFRLEQRSVVVRAGLQFMVKAPRKSLEEALEKMPEKPVREPNHEKPRRFTVTIPLEEVPMLEKCGDVLTNKIGFRPLSDSQICRIAIGLVRGLEPEMVARRVEKMPIGKIGPRHRKHLEPFNDEKLAKIMAEVW